MSRWVQNPYATKMAEDRRNGMSYEQLGEKYSLSAGQAKTIVDRQIGLEDTVASGDAFALLRYTDMRVYTPLYNKGVRSMEGIMEFIRANENGSPKKLRCFGEQAAAELSEILGVKVCMFEGYLVTEEYKLSRLAETTMPFTHNMASDIMDCFENLLEKHGITIPSEDRNGDEGEARLYGMEYANLMDQVEDIIVTALQNAEVDYVPYRFR